MSLFARLVTDGGISPAEAWDMPMDEVMALFLHWGKELPLRKMVAFYMGFEK